MPSVEDKRFYVKICAGPQLGGNPCIYFNKDFPFQIFYKWKWFFDYRAALYKVQHPRHKVELTTGSYDYIPPREEKIKAITNKLIDAKARVTKYENLIVKAKEAWNSLFPIEDEPDYKKAILKIDKCRYEVRMYENELLNLK